MLLRAIFCRETRRLIGPMGLIIILTGWFPYCCLADDLPLKDKGVQVAPAIDENDQPVTHRLPRDSKPSVVITQPGTLLAQKSDTQLILEKLEQLQQRIERLEKKQAEPKGTGLPPTPLPRSESPKEERKSYGGLRLPPPPEPAAKGTIHEQLLQEELGRVQGIIQWKGKPLVGGKVRIVLENYTGVSLASVKKMLSGNGKEPSETDQGLSLATETDSKGRYAFEKVPPGSYRLYWWPDFQTGWVHRLREKPDFEVKSGQSIIQNIPEKLSILKVREAE